jgi:thiamine biosynthesis lipoprotein ApbE
MALTHGRSATAIASDGTLADWIATAATIMPIQEIEKLLVKLPDVRLLVWEFNADKLNILFNRNLL